MYGTFLPIIRQIFLGHFQKNGNKIDIHKTWQIKLLKLTSLAVDSVACKKRRNIWGDLGKNTTALEISRIIV